MLYQTSFVPFCSQFSCSTYILAACSKLPFFRSRRSKLTSHARGRAVAACNYYSIYTTSFNWLLSRDVCRLALRSHSIASDQSKFLSSPISSFPLLSTCTMYMDQFYKLQSKTTELLFVLRNYSFFSFFNTLSKVICLCLSKIVCINR